MPVEMRKRGRPKAFNGPQSQNTIQALDRALDVLEALATPEGMTLSKLADHLGQSTATMHRVLATLERREFVEISPDRQVWHIGPEAYRLGSAFLRRSNVVERSRPIMRELMLETGETSNLGIEKDGQVLFISQVETHESIRAFFPPGTLSPLHASGIGKALLSTYDEDRLSTLFKKRELERFTENTVRSFNHLKAELQRTRERGYAFDDEERTRGMRCVAAPILNVHGEAVAGISVSGPKIRLQDADVHRIGERVRRAASMVSRRIGAP
ncbi:HTH-type transcriptional regulator BhcR [Rhizobium binxianense]|uniref:HTH-type transcriptional regulator BhcR n=1 Tax=Rhizobium binxianense TaxID=3024242 RepID=UPI00235E28F8|nr:HTH-type transcriptional regulator BhcR [Rhizobium sp. MC62]MDC9811064.1 IclR family transcriptional regulator [Rhizobium sp. MC62]